MLAAARSEDTFDVLALRAALFDRVSDRVSMAVLPQSAHWIADLHPVERKRVDTAVAKRQREFATGRACARRALAEMGVATAYVAGSASRRPHWPDDTVGSITHCDGVAAAAVARSDALVAVGLDAEPLGALEPGVVDMVLTDGERRRHAAPGDPAHRRIFSCKETVYKCLNPIVDHYFGFQDVDIVFDGASFVATPTGRRHIDVAWHDLRGRWVQAHGYVWSAAWLPARKQ